jgi:hypothetical protein
MRTRMVGPLLGAALLALAGSGCGSNDSYHNTARPPTPVNLAVSLTDERVRISPARLGAGPVVLIVANESARSRDLTVTPADGGAPCVKEPASTGPINPQGTARVAVALVRGSCVVGVRDDQLTPARLTVGPQRTSAQAELLQP